MFFFSFPVHGVLTPMLLKRFLLTNSSSSKWQASINALPADRVASKYDCEYFRQTCYNSTKHLHMPWERRTLGERQKLPSFSSLYLSHCLTRAHSGFSLHSILTYRSGRGESSDEVWGSLTSYNARILLILQRTHLQNSKHKNAYSKQNIIVLETRRFGWLIFFSSL